jgi:TRAP-type C4-dicarboxylate transport system permease small subunit
MAGLRYDEEMAYDPVRAVPDWIHHLDRHRCRHAGDGAPLLWLQEVTSSCFTYAVFVGASVATRRNDHLVLSALTEKMSGAARRFFEVFNRTVVLPLGIRMIWFGWQNVVTGLGSFRMPSMLPMSYLYLSIPLCGALVALFSLKQIVNGLRNGFIPTVGDGMVRDTGL